MVRNTKGQCSTSAVGSFSCSGVVKNSRTAGCIPAKISFFLSGGPMKTSGANSTDFGTTLNDP